MTPIYHDNVSQFQHIAPGRAQRGGGTENKKNKANHRPTKKTPSGGARFFERKSKKGQLELMKFSAEGGTKSPQGQSKNDTTDNIKNKADSRAK